MAVLFRFLKAYHSMIHSSPPFRETRRIFRLLVENSPLSLEIVVLESQLDRQQLLCHLL